MPRYTYRCLACGYEFDEMVTISKRNEPQVCPKCDTAANRDIEAELSGAVVGDAGDHIRYSDSLGCLAHQIEDISKLHPGAEFVRKGNRYQMVIHNRREKLQRMKERNMEEFHPDRDNWLHQ